MGPPVLTCSNIHKTFSASQRSDASLHVLKGIDLEIREGEMVSIVGASGSGKSTLLHILGGLDSPTEGDVCWGGKEIFSLRDEVLSRMRAERVGFVFQFHHLLPEFTALENVMIPMMILGKPAPAAAARAKELLASVRLADRLDHRPGELSGGEQQRVAVARALANGPSIILADEPSGNLDSASGDQLHDLLRELNEAGRHTFVIVTHNEQFARMSHRILRMEDGKLVETGNPR